MSQKRTASPSTSGEPSQKLAKQDETPVETAVETPQMPQVHEGERVSREPRRAGKYIIGPELGTPQMDCIQQRLGRVESPDDDDLFFTLKILHEDLDGEPSRDQIQARTLLRNEYEMLQQLKEVSGVIRAHEIFEDFAAEERRDCGHLVYTGKIKRRLVLVLDCVYMNEFCRQTYDYINLHRFIQSRRIEEIERLLIFRALVTIVGRLHEQNVIHRDLKLNNVVVNTYSADVLLTNFGLARTVDDNQPLSDQRGSPAYIAPEILMKKPYRGKPCDMWSLGVILFSMFTKKFPFVDSTPPALFKKIRSAEFSFPSDVSVSNDIRYLIRSLLCLDPSERLTAADALSRVNTLLEKRRAKLPPCEDQIVPQMQEPGVQDEDLGKQSGSFELSREQFSRTLEEQASSAKETPTKSFIRPNVLTVQRYRNPALLSMSERDRRSLAQLGVSRSLTRQINNLSLRNDLRQRVARHLGELSPLAASGSGSSSAPSSPQWYNHLSMFPSDPPPANNQSPPATPPAAPVPAAATTDDAQSFLRSLNDLYTHGRFPTATEYREFSGQINTEIARKVTTFLRTLLHGQILVRELFVGTVTDPVERTIELLRRFNVQTEVVNGVEVLKREQTVSNVMFLTLILQIAGYSNNYFLSNLRT